MPRMVLHPCFIGIQLRVAWIVHLHGGSRGNGAATALAVD